MKFALIVALNIYYWSLAELVFFLKIKGRIAQAVMPVAFVNAGLMVWLSFHYWQSFQNWQILVFAGSLIVLNITELYLISKMFKQVYPEFQILRYFLHVLLILLFYGLG